MLKSLKVRKAQHEIIGFVLIIVLVAIVSLVFLAISLRQKPAGLETKSKQVANLLSSMLQYTTDCSVSLPQYESLRDLIKSCYSSDICSNGVNTCQNLKEIIPALLDAAQPDIAANEQPIKGYEFNASYSAQNQGFFVRLGQSDIVYVVKGSCAGDSIGAQEFIPLDAGNIKISLRFCY